MPQGALNLTREAKRRSEEAALQVQGIEATGGMLALSETQRKQTTKTIESSKENFDEKQAENQRKLDEVLTQIDNLQGKIPDLNKQVSKWATYETFGSKIWGTLESLDNDQGPRTLYFEVRSRELSLCMCK